MGVHFGRGEVNSWCEHQASSPSNWEKVGRWGSGGFWDESAAHLVAYMHVYTKWLCM